MVRQGKGPLKSEASEVEQDVAVGLCHSIKVLKSNPRKKEGMALLKKHGRDQLMAPLMRKHGWELPLLTEFFPDNPNLLGMNVNRGRKILIRLRHAHAPDAFIDLDSELVGTMLHELTHNVHGPHDQAFYKYLDGLNDEYDHLRASGYTGEGFLSAGQKLSTATHDARLPLHLARQRALAEAERRQKLQQVMGPPGGQRLGGGGGARQASATASQKTPKQRILEAAERRQRDEKRCGGHEGNDGEGRAEREAAKAAQQAVTIDLTEEEEEAALPQTQPPQPSSSRTTLSDPHSARPQPTNDEADGDDDEVELVAISTPLKKRKRSSSGSTGSAGMGWSCPACTFVNKAECLQCDVCECPREDRQRPPDPQEGFARKAEQPPAAATTGHWVCHTCGRVEEHKWWSCKQCGTIKLSS